MSEISLLQTGIFTDYSPALIKFPTCVVNVLEADNRGIIWFIHRKPCENTNGLETSFYGRLELYNRQYPFYITAKGNVKIHYHKHSLPAKIMDAIDSDYEVAVSLQIREASRVHTKKHPKNMATILTGLFYYLFAA